MSKRPNWFFYDEMQAADAGDGVTRRVLAYSETMMCVENTFKKGAVGAIHSHPHEQITYVAEGVFEFTIGDITRVVTKGDTMLKQDSILHGCLCLEAGRLIDIFSPLREDFLVAGEACEA